MTKLLLRALALVAGLLTPAAAFAALSFSTALRTDIAGQIQTAAGSAAVLEIESGTAPSSCNTTDTGTVLVSITLPATFLTSSGGVATQAGTWSGTASATGTASYYRIVSSSTSPTTTCVVQGSVATTGADLNLSTTAISSGVTVTITGYTYTAGNP